jgi:hypothetical protein
MATTTKSILKRLKEVVHQAQKKIDLESAQNPELQRAIHIVESFLKRSGRVCYGGQAINVQLPAKHQFYNLETSLPDYDFFSPDEKSDIDKIIEELREAGFEEISKRVGIHEGTMKLYVNYTAIADITQIDSDFYNKIHEKSVIVNGIRYADPVFLRMMAYLELSRPRGMLSRWDKVFERLSLLDAAQPLHRCKGGDKTHILENEKSAELRAKLIQYILKNNRVFMGADIHALYQTSGPGRTASSRMKFLLQGHSPTVFMSSDAGLDSNILSEDFDLRSKDIYGYQNILPPMIALYKGDSLVCLIVQEEACHSFVVLPLTNGREMRIASLDTLLTFLIGLYYRDDSIIMTTQSLLCWIRYYIDVSARYRLRPTTMVPSFPVECSGYQTTFASLLRAKAARIEAARQKLVSDMSSMTRRRSVVDRRIQKNTRRRRF